MKLELKDLVGYLPYGLKYKDIPDGFDGIRELNLFNIDWCLSDGKPILRPLSDLTKEIEVNREKFVPITELLRLSNFDVDKMTFENQCTYLNIYNDNLFLNFNDAQKLLEWHFDIYGLIENDLAIDINSL